MTLNYPVYNTILLAQIRFMTQDPECRHLRYPFHTMTPLSMTVTLPWRGVLEILITSHPAEFKNGEKGGHHHEAGDSGKGLETGIPTFQSLLYFVCPDASTIQLLT